MAPGQMVILDRALDGDLPVAGIAAFPASAMAHDREVVAGEEALEGADMVGEVRCLAVDIDEDIVVPARDPDRAQAELGLVEARRAAQLVAAEIRRGNEPPLEIVGPAMPGAAQHGAALAGLRQEPHAAVPADIVEGGDAAVALAHQGERPAGEITGIASPAAGIWLATATAHQARGKSCACSRR